MGKENVCVGNDLLRSGCYNLGIGRKGTQMDRKEIIALANAVEIIATHGGLAIHHIRLMVRDGVISQSDFEEFKAQVEDM